MGVHRELPDERRGIWEEWPQHLGVPYNEVKAERHGGKSRGG